MTRKIIALLCLISAGFLMAARSPFPGVESPGGRIVYHLKISTDIDNVVARHVERTVAIAERRGAKLIIVEINTPGGLLLGAWRVSDSLVSTSIPTVAWINKDAASAGAMITYSCDYIVMAPGATFGACVPMLALPMPKEMPENITEKFISYTREQLRSLASANGHDADIAEAMVDADKEIEFSAKIPAERWQKLRNTLHNWEGASPEEKKEFQWFVDSSGGLSEEKRDALLAFLTPGAKIVEKGKILTLDTDKAFLLNVAIGKAQTLGDIFKLKEIEDMNIGHPVIERVGWTWSESVAKFLSSFWVRALLLVGATVGIFTELKMPGFGFPGILGITCIVLLFFGSYAAGAAEWLDLILFGLGVTLLTLELFVIPGFGFVGVAGIVLIVASIFMMLLKRPGPYLPPAREEVVRVIRWMSASLIVSAALLFVIFKLVSPNVPLFGRLVLATSERAWQGYTAGEKFAVQADVLVGKVGVARSMLRPAGKAVFDGKLFDVVTEGDMIERGSKIRIIEVKGNRIVVQKAGESSAA
jgi:membrane-bound serine protease (ClpP class)